jgi:transcriptional regulator with XRE-family HTH domain
MTPEEAQQLAELLRSHRVAQGLTAREVARRAGVDVGTVTRLEQGQILSPRAESLRAIGEVLNIPAADLFAVAAWLPQGELPSFRPYLRSKYRELSPEAMAEIEAVFERLARDYGARGLVDREDEHD